MSTVEREILILRGILLILVIMGLTFFFSGPSWTIVIFHVFAGGIAVFTRFFPPAGQHSVRDESMSVQAGALILGLLFGFIALGYLCRPRRRVEGWSD